MIFSVLLTSCTNSPRDTSQDTADITAVIYESSDFFENCDINAFYSYEATLGTNDELNNFVNFIKNLDSNDVIRLYFAQSPPFYQGSYAMTESEAFILIDTIKNLNFELLPKSELSNVRTGGGWECYLETNDNQWYFCYNGLWFTVTNKDDASSVIFMCKDASAFIMAINDIIANNMNI